VRLSHYVFCFFYAWLLDFRSACCCCLPRRRPHNSACLVVDVCCFVAPTSPASLPSCFLYLVWPNNPTEFYITTYVTTYSCINSVWKPPYKQLYYVDTSSTHQCDLSMFWRVDTSMHRRVNKWTCHRSTRGSLICWHVDASTCRCIPYVDTSMRQSVYMATHRRTNKTSLEFAHALMHRRVDASMRQHFDASTSHMNPVVSIRFLRSTDDRGLFFRLTWCHIQMGFTSVA